MSTFPSMNHTDTTSKRAGGVNYEYAASWASHPEEIFSLAQPDFIGWKEFYWGQNPLKFNAEYFGIIFLVLAIAAFLNKKPDFLKKLLAGYFIFAVLFSLGSHTPIHKFLYNLLPGMKSFRAPSMMYIWYFFPGMILAALSLEELLRIKWEKGSVMAKRLMIYAGIVLGLGFLYLVGTESFAEFWYNSIYPGQIRSESKYAVLTRSIPHIKTGAILIFASVLGFLVIAYLKVTDKIKRNTFLILIACICLFDLLRISRPFLTQTLKAPDQFTRQEKWEHSIADFLRKQDPSLYRVHSMLGDQKMYIPGLDLTYIFDDFINKQYNDIIQRLQSLSYAFQQPQYREDQSIKIQFRNLLSLINAKYILCVNELEIPGFRAIVNQRGFKIYENKGAYPFFHFAENIHFSSDPLNALLERSNRELFSTHTAILHNRWKDAAVSGDIPDTLFQNNISVVSYEVGNGKVVLEATSDRKQVLVFSQNYNGGWKAVVNGQSATIFPVNHTWQGVTVPKGKSTVTFTFNSSIASFWRKANLYAFIAFFLFILAAGIYEIKKFRAR
jgi:hypothetical protein